MPEFPKQGQNENLAYASHYIKKRGEGGEFIEAHRCMIALNWLGWPRRWRISEVFITESCGEERCLGDGCGSEAGLGEGNLTG